MFYFTKSIYDSVFLDLTKEIQFLFLLIDVTKTLFKTQLLDG